MDISMKTAAVNLNAFHLFAAINKDDDNRIAQFGATRNIQVATGDHVRTPFRDSLRAGIFAHWGRHGEANAQANDTIREFFITSLLRTLGCDLNAHGITYDAQTGRYSGVNKANLKAAAMSVFNNDEDAVKVLKLGDYGRGRPLTARRIAAALSAVDKVLDARAKVEGENGVNSQLWQGIHMGGFAEDVVPQNVQVANEQPQPRTKFIALRKPSKNESVDVEPQPVKRDLKWAEDVIRGFRTILKDDDDDPGFYNSFRAEKDGETYNALMKLGEKSKEVQELLDENQELLDEMRGFVERCL